MQNLPPSQWYINFCHFTNVPAAALLLRISFPKAKTPDWLKHKEKEDIYLPQLSD
jgi:hypothetical protein